MPTQEILTQEIIAEIEGTLSRQDLEIQVRLEPEVQVVERHEEEQEVQVVECHEEVAVGHHVDVS